MKWRVLLTGALALLSFASGAQQPGFVIRQVSVHLPSITAYLDLPPQNGRPQRIRGSDISAVTIQGQNLKLENVSISQGIAYTFLLDVSGSMRIRKDVLGAIRNWIDRLHPDDHVDVFAFGETFRQVGLPTSDRATLKSELAKLSSGEQTTNLYFALVRGIANAERIDNSLPEGRIIILVTDGKNEGSNNGMDEARAHEEIRKSHIPIYSIGYTRLGAKEQDTYLAKMKSFADESGGFYDCAGTVHSALCPPKESPQSQNLSLERALEKLGQRMENISVLHLKCDHCQETGKHDLQISLKNGSTAQIPVLITLLREPPPPKPIPIWVYVAGALLLLVVLLLVWLAFKKKPKPPAEIEREVPEHVEVPPKEPGLPAHFTIVSGPEPGRVYKFELGAKAVIGRDTGCDVALTGDKEISGRHCELTRNGKRVEIVDLGSMNGTLLNGARVIAHQRVEDGDLIRVGRTEFRVRFGDRE